MSEWIVIGCAAAFLAKPGDVGRAARSLGWTAGRAVRASEQAAAAMHALTGKDHQLASLKMEVIDSLEQVKQLHSKIDRVRYDVIRPWKLGARTFTETERLKDAEASRSLDAFASPAAATSIDQQGVIRLDSPVQGQAALAASKQRRERGLAAFGMDPNLHAAGLEVEQRSGAADLLIETIIERRIARSMKRFGASNKLDVQ